MIDAPKGHKKPPQPVWLWLDPTTRCNLSCVLCYTKMSHGKLDLEPEELRSVLSALRDSSAVDVKSIHLNWRGEPMMNPRQHELLGVVRDEMPTMKLQWHTNGTMLNEKRVQEILDVNWPHKIFVSIDGGNESAHDQNRGQGTFRRTMRGLKTLLDRREAQGRDDLVVGVYQIDLGEPIENYDPEFLSLVKRVDDHVKVKPLLPLGVEHELQELSDLDDDDTLNHMVAQELAPSMPVPHGPCFWAGNVFCMAPNGDVSVCVISHGRWGLVGNLMTQTPEEVLSQANAFRAKLAAQGRKAVPHCRNCRKPEGGIFAQHLHQEAVA